MPIVFAFCIWACTANPDAGNDHVINGSIAHVSQYNWTRGEYSEMTVNKAMFTYIYFGK